MIKVLQFGEGNFLRAFAEDYIDIANEKGLIDASVTICQPRSNTKVINALNAQNCVYTVNKRGRLNGEVVDETVTIDCVERCIDTVGEYAELEKAFAQADVIISNTTEAGIAFVDTDVMENTPNISFPGKVTALLYKRFKSGEGKMLFLPVELIENNADELKKCILQYADLWTLGDEFKAYVDSCSFCNTLVDRIVSGHDDASEDECSVNCEPYASWIIQADDYCKEIFPIDSLEGVVFAEDILPYRTRKVRILNGTHTMSVLAAYQCKIEIVRDMMQDETFGKYIALGLEEIKSTLDLDRKSLDEYANSVLDRFNNPFIDHRLLDIALNSVSKFKARCLDSMLEYTENRGEAPEVLTFALAALVSFYLNTDKANDSADVIEFFANLKGADNDTVISKVCKLFGIDNDNIINKALMHYNNICNNGMKNAVTELVNE